MEKTLLIRTGSTSKDQLISFRVDVFLRGKWLVGHDLFLMKQRSFQAEIRTTESLMKISDNAENTIELRPNVFESMSESNIAHNGKNAGFFHSLGRAIQGEKVDNEFLKANQN
ncbi:hypothetical protein [Shewanella sp. GD04112]|uniref:hypothetical protein n=1 Tax=Shewanella sp. GD04112 TaxID=2975434 RepID=UPI00244AEF96|nr:hypothetical protein [Shewanella sp. GD04112]MDH0450890.1 hypothetical protein [Shewanella sp. GD04112]